MAVSINGTSGFLRKLGSQVTSKIPIGRLHRVVMAFAEGVLADSEPGLCWTFFLAPLISWLKKEARRPHRKYERDDCPLTKFTFYL